MVANPLDVGIKEAEAAARHEAAHAVFAVLLDLPLKGVFLRDKELGTGTAIGSSKKKKERKKMAFCLAAGMNGLDAQDRKDAKKIWKRGDFDKLSAAASLVLELPGVAKAVEETAARLMGMPGEITVRGRTGDLSPTEVRRIVESHVRPEVVAQIGLICRSACKKAKKAKKAA